MLPSHPAAPPYPTVSIPEEGVEEHQQKDGSTGLYIACKAGHVEVVRILLQAGSDVDRTTNKGFTPLYRASLLGHSVVVQDLLRAAADPEMCDQVEQSTHTP